MDTICQPPGALACHVCTSTVCFCESKVENIPGFARGINSVDCSNPTFSAVNDHAIRELLANKTLDPTKLIPHLPDDIQNPAHLMNSHIGSNMHVCAPRWHKALTGMHSFFCCDPCCGGLPTYESLEDSPNPSHNHSVRACVYAKESTWLLESIKYGYRTIDETKPPPTPTNTADYPQTKEAQAHIEKDIVREWLHGWLYMIPDYIAKLTTPTFAKPEKDKVRIIKDSTASGLNDSCIHYATSLVSIKNAIPYLYPRAYQFKLDVDSAFRNLPLYPKHAPNTTYKAFGRTFCDTRASFGCRPSPLIFNRTTALIRLIVISQLNPPLKEGMLPDKFDCDLLVYVDDFWGCNTRAKAERTFNCLKATLIDLGLTPSSKPGKTIPPTQVLTWLGFVINTNLHNRGMVEIRADPAKLAKLTATLWHMKSTRKASKQKLEKLLGLLVHVAVTIYGSKAFYKNIIALIHDPEYNGEMNHKQFTSFKLDAQFWIELLKDYDGKALIVELPCINTHYIATDACIEPNASITLSDPTAITATGIGYFLKGNCLSIHATSAEGLRTQLRQKANPLQLKHQGNFPFRKGCKSSNNIAYLELFTIWWMISSDPTQFANKLVPIHIDNSNNLAWLQKETAPPNYLSILRPLQLLMCSYNIRLYPVLIPSKVNEIADMLSRGVTDGLDRAIADWEASNKGELDIKLPNHTRPGPMHLFKKGYWDGTIMTPDMTWQELTIPIQLHV